MAKKSEVQINYAPSDVISCVCFSPSSSQFLAASSWDGTVRLYDTSANAMRQKYHHNTPVLDVCFQVSYKISYFIQKNSPEKIPPYDSSGPSSSCIWIY